MKSLKLFNGRGWQCDGHLFIAANSVKDAIDLSNRAYRKMRGLEDRLDIKPTSTSEMNVYWSKGCWGTPMDGINPERGVWWVEKPHDSSEKSKPKRIL